MSIVLLVIALITGSVVAVKSMFTRTQSRAVISEYDRHLKAIKEFEEKYNMLPGDMNNAISFWGDMAAGGCPDFVTWTTTLPTGTATCDGNGDGRIGFSNDSGNIFAFPPGSAFSRYYETWLVWQHLSNAGLIDGRFTGRYAELADEGQPFGNSVPGINVPASEIKSAGWSITYFQDVAGTSNYVWPDRYGHIMSIGSALNDTIPAGPILTNSQAYEIDLKIDDGLPGLGKVRAWRSALTGNTDCTIQIPTGSLTAATEQYRYKNKGQACSLFFITGF